MIAGRAPSPVWGQRQVEQVQNFQTGLLPRFQGNNLLNFFNKFTLLEIVVRWWSVLSNNQTLADFKKALYNTGVFVSRVQGGLWELWTSFGLFPQIPGKARLHFINGEHRRSGTYCIPTHCPQITIIYWVQNVDTLGEILLRDKFLAKTERGTFNAVIFLFKKHVVFTREAIVGSLSTYNCFASLSIDKLQFQTEDEFQLIFYVTNMQKEILIAHTEVDHGSIQQWRDTLQGLILEKIQELKEAATKQYSLYEILNSGLAPKKWFRFLVNVYFVYL